MKVLLAIADIYTATGGGQSFYADLIRSNPSVKFTFFSSRPISKDKLPPNVTAILLPNRYRQDVSHLGIDPALTLNTVSLAGAEGDVFYLLDMASAVAGKAFDILEIPDFQPYAALLPALMHNMGADIGRIVLSMHGTLSHALADNWAPDNLFPFEKLRIFEKALYNVVDIRYGISRPYLEEWRDRSGISGHLLDIQTVMDFDSFRRRRERLKIYWSGTTRPDLVYIGRHEKCKGPDLFVDHASMLPRSSFSNVRIIGPSVTISGYSSSQSLSRMGEWRKIDLLFENISREELLSRYTTSPWFVYLPSRRDTFNLACLEAILSGCPTAISSAAGVSDYLKFAFTEVPCIHVDPTNLYASGDAIVHALLNYNDAHRTLNTVLDGVAPRPFGSSIETIWKQNSESNIVERGQIEQLVEDLLESLNRNGRSKLAQSRYDTHSVQIDQIFHRQPSRHSRIADDGNAKDSINIISDNRDLVNFLKELPVQAIELQSIRRRTLALTGGFFAVSDAQLKNITDSLAPFVFSGNRVAIYDFLAEVESKRGNQLLYATYKVRSIRLSGIRSQNIVDSVMDALRSQGFSREADVVGWLYGPTEDIEAAWRYLDETKTRFFEPPVGAIEFTRDLRGSNAPKASIIVSMYKAADKLPTFLRGLSRMTEHTRQYCEIILVDSYSPDNTYDVAMEEIKEIARLGTALSVLYIRTAIRETIQCAWNRGIVHARADYVAFLGVDEMNRPDAFDIMIDYLDTNPEVDWIQGTAIVVDVSPNGTYVRDAMAYDRRFDNDLMQLLDTCFVGYVGALYRKSIHDKVGFYDASFRGAGDTEFKNRALPFMHVATLPVCLGWFLNYPDERVTQSPAVEIEDLRAWYIHRSVAGMRYHFDNESHKNPLDLFYKCMSYNKSYMGGESTDLELASAVYNFLLNNNYDQICEIQFAAMHISNILDSYRNFDNVDLTARQNNWLESEHYIRKAVLTASARLAASIAALGANGWDAQFKFHNDNRSHQHFGIWPTTPTNPTVTAKPHAPVLVAGADDDDALIVSPALTFEIVVDAAAAQGDLVCRVDGRDLSPGVDRVGKIVFTRAGRRRERGAWTPRIEFLDGNGGAVRGVAIEIVVDLPAATDPITGDRALSVENLFYVEKDGTGRPSHRWTGPGCTAQISVPIACRTEGSLEITLPHLGPNDVGEVAVAINGRPTAIDPEQRGWIDHSTVTLPLPTATEGGALTVAEIAITTARTHASPGDDRAIGVAWSRARLVFPLRI